MFAVYLNKKRMRVVFMNPNPVNWSREFKETLLFEGAKKISSRPTWWMSCMNRTGKSSRPTKKQTIVFEKDGKKTSKIVYHLA